MNGPDLLAAYKTLKSSSFWNSTGKCKGYAVQNPGEAAQIDTYVDALSAGSHPTPPALSTSMGKGIVGMLAALAATVPPPPLTVKITGTAMQGQKLTAVIW